ncbi:MAG: uracil-DNA glycosylase [Cytophagales bacterium]|nr:MAG: uracil-DNA glycosylase [Cytophagales bacterium]
MIDNLSNDWNGYLKPEANKSYFKQLEYFIQLERQMSNIFPSSGLVFNALQLCSFANTKIVIIGQDPYHGLGQANGLAFSVNEGVKLPPSLKNIFKELNADLGIRISNSGNLQSWANQGVLLINSILTVKENTPSSHKDRGWEQFTDTLISLLSDQKNHLVFMLWGAYAQEKGKIIDSQKHLVLMAPHPSPFSAHKGFLGCKHFSKANQYLLKNNLSEIIWNV